MLIIYVICRGYRKALHTNHYSIICRCFLLMNTNFRKYLRILSIPLRVVLKRFAKCIDKWKLTV